MNITEVANSLSRLENDTGRIQFQQNQKNVGSDKLGKDAFLQLLLAQLKYQDPTDPVNDKEFISQQAQFTQIEKLDELNATMQQANQISQASAMIGKRVALQDSNGSTVTGRIESAMVNGSSVGLQIGGQTYSIGQITNIYGD